MGVIRLVGLTQETGRALAFGFATCLTLFVFVLVASALCRREGGTRH